MASFLQIENLTKSYGDRVLFADVTFGVNEGDKIGLIAKNGMGKTTLLRCIAGTEGYDSGSVVFRNGLKTGFLEQIPNLDNDKSVLETCIADNGKITEAIDTYEHALSSNDARAITAASELMDAAQAWDYEDRLKQMLSQLGISDLTQPVGQLSGGQKKRVALAKIILESPQLIILDEPTNHLDIYSIEWLENYLSRSRVTLLMVTHDRYFLDRVCSKIIEIDRSQIYIHEGNYANYLRRRRERNVELSVKSSYIGSKIFEATHICKKFGEKRILDDFSYIFSRYEKVGIIGRNGVGKSTFIKMLLGIEPSDSGTWDIGETVKFGYYNQDGISFDPSKKVIDAITEISEDIVLNDGQQRLSPSQFLQQFLFTPADQQKLIAKLSGGERSRLYLASVLMKSPNFLILDEPTNDLDIVTLGILEEYLANFKGCAIVISHDRYFLDNIVDHLFVLEGDGVIKDFPGNYTDYRKWKQETDEAEKAAAEQKKAAQTNTRHKPADNRPAKMTFKERKEFEELTAEIDSLTAERAALEAEFNSGATITDIETKSRRYNELADILDEKEMRWLELSEKQ